MWKHLKIEQEDYFLLCSISADDEVKFVLYNLRRSWSGRMSLEAALQTTKNLNKRIQFPAATVRDTLQRATPEECAWLPCGADTTERVLKLKYRVMSRPFNFEWRLRAQSAEEHNESMLLPLLKAVQGMAQQIDELRSVVRKKDIEIAQYKTEGAILRRTTVATKPFDISAFEAKFADTESLSASLLPVAEQLETHFESIPALCKTPEPKVEDSGTIKTETKQNAESPQAASDRLKKKKRRALEMQQKHVARKLQAQKQKIVYESQSQSQSCSQSSTETVEQPVVEQPPVKQPAVVQPAVVQPAVVQPAVALEQPAVVVSSTTALAAQIDDFLAHSERLDAEPQDKESQALLEIQRALQNLEEQRIADMKRRSQDGVVPCGSVKLAKMTRIQQS